MVSESEVGKGSGGHGEAGGEGSSSGEGDIESEWSLVSSIVDRDLEDTVLNREHITNLQWVLDTELLGVVENDSSD